MDILDALHRAEVLAPDGTADFVRHGHFAYESGDHGDTWLALDLLFADPHRLQHAAARLADRLRPFAPDFLCGPLVGGALVAQWIALALNATFVYATPRSSTPSGSTTYAIPQSLAPLLAGKRTVVVDDAINAGWATRECIREIERHHGAVIAIAALIVRSPAPSDLPGPIISLAELRWNTWPAVDCPLCSAGMPIEQTR